MALWLGLKGKIIKMDNIIKRLGNLITIKSITTLTLTLVFAYLAITKTIGADMVMQIFVMIISFYYGTTKRDDTSD